MRTSIFRFSIACLLLTPSLALAQTTSTSGSDRLFLSFIEDAARVENQWWEAQIEYADADSIDTSVLRGVVAFQPLADLEMGARVGFGSSDTAPGLPDGTGATDLDAWAKYYFGASGGRNEFAAGAVLTVPTGDDTAGLGTDAFGLGLFGAVRHRLDRVVLVGNLGLRLNGDAEFLGLAERDGEVSAFVGLGALVPWTDELTFVGELDLETERFDGGDEDIRALAGIDLRVGNRSRVRGAVGVGLSDGAPDVQVTLGYAYTF